MRGDKLRQARLKAVREWRLLPITVEECVEAERQIARETPRPVVQLIQPQYAHVEVIPESPRYEPIRNPPIAPSPPLPPKIKTTPELMRRILEVRPIAKAKDSKEGLSDYEPCTYPTPQTEPLPPYSDKLPPFKY